MSLWLYEETAPFAFSLADELTELRVALILRGAWEPDEPACCDVIDLAAERAAREARAH